MHWSKARQDKISRLLKAAFLNFPFLLLGCCGAIFATGVEQAKSGIQGEVLAGFGGYYRIGKCMPIKVRLTNSGPDITGEIAVRMREGPYAVPLSLPSPSRKTLSFYVVPTEDLHEIQVDLLSNGSLVATFKSPVRRLGDQELLSISSATLGSASPAEGKVIRISVDPADLPEEWRDYEAVDAVTMDRSDTSKLTEIQRSALSRWTLLGGNVKIFDRDQQLANQPIETPHGMGSFGMVGGLQHSANGNPPPSRASLLDVDAEIFDAVRIRDPIPRTAILWGVAVFFLVYGIFLALWLWISSRTRWGTAWTLPGIPIVVLAFSILCPGIHLLIKSGQTEVRQRSIIHVFANTADTFTTHGLNLLSARKEISRFSPKVPSTYLVQNDSEEKNSVRYQFQGRDAPMLLLNSDLWKPWQLNIASFSESSAFQGLRGPDTVTLTNRSAWALHDCRLIQHGASASLGNIPAGQEIRLRLDTEAGAPVSGYARDPLFSRLIAVYETETAAGSIGDCVVCTMAGTLPSLASDDAQLSYSGSTAVVYHLASRQEHGGDSDKK